MMTPEREAELRDRCFWPLEDPACSDLLAEIDRLRGEVERLTELSEDHELVIERLESVVALLRADAERLADVLDRPSCHTCFESETRKQRSDPTCKACAALRQHEEQA